MIVPSPRVHAPAPLSLYEAIARLGAIILLLVGIDLFLFALMWPTGGYGRALVGGATLLLVFSVLLLCLRCLVTVEPGQALLGSERNRQQMRAWLPGYHLLPPGMYKGLASVATWPQDRERILEHVLLLGGTPLTLKLSYTGSHPLPRATAMLPRRGRSGPLAADDMIIRNLYIAHNYPEIWQRIAGNAIDSAVRDFFSGLRVEQVCDPAGTAALPLDVLRTRLNEHLAQTVARDLNYQVRVHTVVIMDGSGQELLTLRQRVGELGGLITQLGNVAPDQLLRANELLKDLTGRGMTNRVAVDLGGLFLAQTPGPTLPAGPERRQVPPPPTVPTTPPGSAQHEHPPAPPLPPWDTDSQRPAV